MKKFTYLLLIFAGPASAGEVSCAWGINAVENRSEAEANHYLGEPFVLQTNLPADWHYQVNSNPIVNLGAKPADARVGVIPTVPGTYTIRGFRVMEGYCQLSEFIYAFAPEVGSITVSGNLWTVNSLTFDGNTSGGVLPLSYLWNFGDGNSSTDRVATHEYNDPGTYQVTLTFEDGNGRTSTRQTSVTIIDNPNVPGKPGSLFPEFSGCTGGLADYLVHWTASGAQPSNYFLYKFKLSSSNWSTQWLTSPIVFESGLENALYDIEVRGCLSTSEATCGPMRAKSFNAQSCGGGNPPPNLF